MDKTIDTHLFIEIIVSEGCNLLFSDYVNDDKIEYYHGLSGRKVAICITDEYLSANTAKQYLHQLGLVSLLQRGLFKD